MTKKTLTTDLETKAFVHPLRMEILRILAEKEATLSDLAAALNTSPGSLSHHLKLLLETELIRMVRQEVRGRQTHKLYRSVAKIFDVRSTDDTQGLNDTVLTFLRDDLEIARTHLGPDDDEFVFGLIKNARVPEKELRNFCKRLHALVLEFAAADTDGEKSHSINVSVYEQKRDYGAIGSINLSKTKRKKK